jgi:hypothetical protein
MRHNTRRFPGTRIAAGLAIAAGCAAVTENPDGDVRPDTLDVVDPDTADETLADQPIDTTCPAGLTWCTDGCADLATDPDHCGTCETACPAPFDNTVAACDAGSCRVHCAPGWIDVDGVPGCETACPGGGTEICNGFDDDCDGITDDGFPCRAGETLACATPCGTTGSGRCTAACEIPTGAACSPPAEACNGADDDCDGATDEELPCAPGDAVACTTSCGSAGTVTCTATCEIPTDCPIPAETCNGADDDCDGRTDENLAGCPTCVRGCDGRDCGDDGCGGACGTCAAPAVCGTDGRCAAPTCAVQGCDTGTQNRDRCTGARIIGRRTASGSSGYRISDDTCYASDRFDDSTSCWDAGADHAYRIFMRAGERIDVSLEVDWACPAYDTYSWRATLKIFANTGCTDALCANKVYCEDNIGSSHSTSYTATADSWYVIVVDGSSAFDDEEDYVLTVRLTCAVAGCEC